LNTSLKFHIKVFLIIENFSLLSKALGKERPAMFPKTGPLWRELPVSRALLNISFRAPSKGVLPPSSPHRAPTKRDAPLPDPSIRLSKSLINEPLSRFPSGTPMERDARLHSLPIHTFRVPNKGASLQIPLTELPQTETPHFQSPPSLIFQSPC